jgi:hypothetical protein
MSGKATTYRGWSEVAYHGDCVKPIRLNQVTFAYKQVTWLVRCRKCSNCLKAKRTYWALAAIEQARLAEEQGRRTWFGTLTLSSEAQAMIQDRAMAKWFARPDVQTSKVPEWFDDPLCDYRFGLVRDELLREVQLYWKRLRKAGHEFSYMLVFERHKSGHPHMHWLLHEKGQPILKRHLQSQWSLGFTQVKLVGRDKRKHVSPERAAWYVAKYLGKTVQARQIASRLYRPSRVSRMKLKSL